MTFAADMLEKAGVKVLIHTRQGVIGDAPPSLESAGPVFRRGKRATFLSPSRFADHAGTGAIWGRPCRLNSPAR